MENEIWKDVPDYEGLYKVSDLGHFVSYDKKVKTVYNSCRIIKGRLLKPRLDSQKRYFLIDLSKCNKKTTRLAHRIVALTHIPNPKQLPEVNHKYGNTQSLLAKDLEWSSRTDNEIHKYRVLKVKHPFSGKEGKLHARSIPVLMYDLKTGAIINQYESNRLAEKAGYSSSAISMCCNNKQVSHRGYGWRFV